MIAARRRDVARSRSPRVTPRAGPITRVRGAVMVSSLGNSIAIQFTPVAPAIGNAVVVQVATYSNYAAPSSVTDNYGNVYLLARYFDGSGSSGTVSSAAIYYCPKLTASGTSPTFTITIGLPSANLWTAGATEVANVGNGLAVQATAAQFNTTFNGQPTTGPTSTISASEAFAVAVLSLNGSQASIAIGATGPTWVQEWENLSAGNEAGEADSASISGATGTTVTASWTVPSASNWCALVVVFGETTERTVRLFAATREAPGVLASVPLAQFGVLISVSGVLYAHISTDGVGVWEYAQVNQRRGA